MPAVQVRCWHSESIPGQSVATMQGGGPPTSTSPPPSFNESGLARSGGASTGPMSPLSAAPSLPPGPSATTSLGASFGASLGASDASGLGVEPPHPYP